MATKKPVYAVFDIGKTNKKLILFDEERQIIDEMLHVCTDVLDDDEMTGGDFVRNIKQCIDLLRQIADVAPDPATRERARDAADACHRGVVTASGVAG